MPKVSFAQIDREMLMTDLIAFEEDYDGMEEIHGDSSTAMQPEENIYSEKYDSLRF